MSDSPPSRPAPDRVAAGDVNFDPKRHVFVDEAWWNRDRRFRWDGEQWQQPQWSADGNYWWDGAAWILATRKVSTAIPTSWSGPGSIRWAAGLIVIQGFFVCAAQIVITFAGNTSQPVWARVLIFVFGICDLVFGVGLYTRRYWAWIGALATQGLAVLLGPFVLGPAVSAFGILVLVLLWQSSARGWIKPSLVRP